LRKRGAAIIPRNGGWCGVALSAREGKIADLRIIEKDDLSELRAEFADDGYGMAVDNGSGYLFMLTFPFSDKRRIKLVVGGELEERLPVSVDDLAIDFVETVKGSVLAAAVPKALTEGIAEDKRLRITTMQAVAVLHALRWLNVIYLGDFVFLHQNGTTMIVMGFKGDGLCYLRQFFHTPQSDALDEAISEIAADKTLSPRAYFLVSDSGDAQQIKQHLEVKFHIHVEMPSLRKVLMNEAAEDWLWPAVGTALLSIAPKGRLNLTGERHSAGLFLFTKTALYGSAALACAGIIMAVLFSLDHYFKESAYEYLVAEQNRLYRLSFPKSPPVREPVKMFREKIRLLDKNPGAIAVGANPLAVLNEISAGIGPDIDVKVSEFASDEKEFTMSGTTVSFASIEKIKAALEHMHGVSQVEMQNLDLAAGREVKFKIRGKL